MRGKRIVVVLERGQITKIVSDHFDAEVLFVHDDNPDRTELFEVKVDAYDVDRYFDSHMSSE